MREVENLVPDLYDRSIPIVSELELLQQENRRLSDQVKRLVKTESKLYACQEQLDGQLRVYRQLNEAGKKFNRTFDLDEILQQVIRFVIYELNLERCLILMPLDQSFEVKAFDGYHDEDSLKDVAAINLPTTAPVFQSLAIGADSIICQENCSQPLLLSLCTTFQMDEYVIFPLGVNGLLIAGNTTENCPYLNRIQADSESILGLANLVSHATTAINNVKFYQALQQEQQLLEEKVSLRTQELNNKNAFLEKTLHELKQTQLQLIQSEKMSSLGQLVAGIAHEINNPVNFIHGNVIHANEYIKDLLKLLQVYQECYQDPCLEVEETLEDIDFDFLVEDFPRLLHSMQIGTNRIQEIVMSLKNFSRMDQSDMKAVDIHDGIESTLVILQHRLKPKPDHPEIQVTRDYGQLPLIECYAGQLNQVFINLVANAIDALDERDAQRSPSDRFRNPSALHIQTEMRSDRVRISIADNGTGIPVEVQQRLFDPFFTTKPVGKGTGLGLSISYKIVVEKHSGELRCISSPGQGTEFVIEIPA